MLRLSLGLSSLTVSLLLAAHALGLLPDRDGAVVDGRRALCESLAITCSLAAQENDLATVRSAIRAVAERNRDVLAVAFLGPDGKVLAKAGASSIGGEPRGGRSTATRMHVPINL